MSTRCKACDAQVRLTWYPDRGRYEELCSRCLAVVGSMLGDGFAEGALRPLPTPTWYPTGEEPDA